MNYREPLILIIEDDFMIREIITTILECEHFQVIETDQGSRGIELAEQLLPDLIICDIMMPNLTGFNVLNQLKKKKETATIPFIFVSAKAKKVDVHFGIELGADDYICKPFTRNQLISAITKCLDRKIAKKSTNPQKNDQLNKKINQLNTKIDRLIQTNSHQIFTPTYGWQRRFKQVVITADKIIAMNQEINHALNQEEFELYYQPQIDISSEKIIGAEALLRWKHPERGLIYPAEFMPVAESQDTILSIGDWVLKTGCKQVNKWQSMGLSLRRFSTNISDRQFKSLNFASRIFEILIETALSPKHIELELTESNFVKNIPQSKKILTKLKNIGVRIAIDDFGTAYSSLNYLNKLEFNTLKISKVFVEDMDRYPQKQAVVQSMIELGHLLNLNILAEGVETEAELAFLKEQQCDEFQGYLFSKPLPVQDFEALLKANHNN